MLNVGRITRYEKGEIIVMRRTRTLYKIKKIFLHVKNYVPLIRVVQENHSQHHYGCCDRRRGFFIVVLPCILISSKLLRLQMHYLLKHKVLQLTLQISLYMAPTYFGPFGPSSGSIRRNIAKVTDFVEIISKNTSL
jgi:hypothetical protein